MHASLRVVRAILHGQSLSRRVSRTTRQVRAPIGGIRTFVQPSDDDSRRLNFSPYKNVNSNLDALRRILANFKRKNVQAAEAVFQQLRETGEDDWAVWDLMIRGYLYLTKLTTAEALLAELKRPEHIHKLNAAHFQRFIVYHVSKNNNHIRATRCLDEMKQLGITPTEKSIIFLCNAYLYRDHNYHKVIELFEFWKRVSPTSSISARLISRVCLTYTNLGQHENVIKTYNAMLDAYKQPSADTHEEPNEEQLEDEQMEDNYIDSEHQPDDSQQGDYVPTKPLRPEEFCAGLAIRSCMFRGESAMALDIFKRIQEFGFRVSENAAHGVAQIMHRSSGVEGLIRLTEQLLETKPEPDPGCYPSIFGVLIAAKEHKAAEDYYNAFAHRVPDGVRPLLIAKVLDIYSKEGNAEKVKEITKLVLDQLPAKVATASPADIKAAKYAFTHALSAQSRIGNLAGLDSVWNTFVGGRETGGYGFKPSSFHLATMCQGLAAVGEYARAFNTAATYMARAKEGLYNIHYYFAVTFVSKVVLKSGMSLGRGYKPKLGRWLDKKGPTAKKVMPPSDSEDFLADFESWHTGYKQQAAELARSQKRQF